MAKTDDEILEDYIKGWELDKHIPKDMHHNVRIAAKNSFGFARYRFAVRVRELGKTLLSAFKLK